MKNFLKNLLLNLALNLWGLVPALVLLILHFVFHIPLKWTFIALGAWVAYIAVRLIVITFFSSLPKPTKEEEYRENKNPYSNKNSR